MFSLESQRTHRWLGTIPSGCGSLVGARLAPCRPRTVTQVQPTFIEGSDRGEDPPGGEENGKEDKDLCVGHIPDQ